MITANARAKLVVKFASPFLELSPMQESNLAEVLYTLSEAEYVDISTEDAVIIHSLVNKIIGYGDSPIPPELCM